VGAQWAMHDASPIAVVLVAESLELDWLANVSHFARRSAKSRRATFCGLQACRLTSISSQPPRIPKANSSPRGS
jgi:hypothetical protein